MLKYKKVPVDIVHRDPCDEEDHHRRQSHLTYYEMKNYCSATCSMAMNSVYIAYTPALSLHNRVQ